MCMNSGMAIADKASALPRSAMTTITKYLVMKGDAQSVSDRLYLSLEWMSCGRLVCSTLNIINLKLLFCCSTISISCYYQNKCINVWWGWQSILGSSQLGPRSELHRAQLGESKTSTQDMTNYPADKDCYSWCVYDCLGWYIIAGVAIQCVDPKESIEGISYVMDWCFYFIYLYLNFCILYLKVVQYPLFCNITLKFNSSVTS